jgi:hypothetical protein
VQWRQCLFGECIQCRRLFIPCDAATSVHAIACLSQGCATMRHVTCILVRISAETITTPEQQLARQPWAQQRRLKIEHRVLVLAGWPACVVIARPHSARQPIPPAHPQSAVARRQAATLHAAAPGMNARCVHRIQDGGVHRPGAASCGVCNTGQCPLAYLLGAKGPARLRSAWGSASPRQPAVSRRGRSPERVSQPTLLHSHRDPAVHAHSLRPTSPLNRPPSPSTPLACRFQRLLPGPVARFTHRPRNHCAFPWASPPHRRPTLELKYADCILAALCNATSSGPVLDPERIRLRRRIAYTLAPSSTP